MGASLETTRKFAASLRDGTDTTAAIHLLKEALTGGPMVSLQVAEKVVDNENLKKDPKISNVVKELLALAGAPGVVGSKWERNQADQKWHLETVITIGGAVYTVEFIQEGLDRGTQAYTVNIESKLAQEGGKLPSRGKLFFNPGHKATVSLFVKPDGDLYALTKSGLEVNANSFSNYPFQTEILAKCADELEKGNDNQLALVGTGGGKSILMAGLAQALQALGPCVMIVPDAILAGQQAKEVQSMLGKGKVHGVMKKPLVFTFEEMKGKVDDPSDPEQVRSFFAKVLNGTSIPKYDQIVLQANHPAFPIAAAMMKDQMVLIDEAHTFTFTKESLAQLQQMQAHNALLAFTATPTPDLYAQFPSGVLTDLNLGEAIGIKTIRPINAEVEYCDEEDLVDRGIIKFFNDTYIKPGSIGYADPIAIKAQLMKADKNMPEDVAQAKAIDMALERNRLRCQRNMAFSDDKATRDQVTSIFNKISEGDSETIDKYKDDITALRHNAEINARLQMTLLFTKETDPVRIQEQRSAIERATPVPKVELVKDIEKEEQRNVLRTVNSFAMALIFGDKPSSIGEKDRTGKLKAHAASYDEEILKYHPSNQYGTNKNIPDHLLIKFKECEDHTRESLRTKLMDIESTLGDLPPKQREIMIRLIIDRAEELSDSVRFSNTISSVIDAPISTKDLKDLEVGGSYALQLDTKTPEKRVKEIVAMLDAGMASHIISDEIVATGVSLKDVLSEITFNTYTPVVSSNPNAISGTLSGPQGVGRVARHTDVEATAIQLVDKRFQDTNLILTVDKMIDSEHSAEHTKLVTMTRDAQSKKENKAALAVQTFRRAHTTRSMFQQHKPRLSELKDEIDQVEEALELQGHKLTDGKQYLSTLKDKLTRCEQFLKDRKVEGDKHGGVPPKYRNDKEVSYHWMQRKLLTRLAGKTESNNKHIETAMRQNQQQLSSLVEERDALLEKIRSAPSQPRAANE